MNQVAGSNNSYKPITNTGWVRARLCKLQKGCTRLAHCRWLSPASSNNKTGRHDIAEILLKVAFKHQKSINQTTFLYPQLCEYSVILPKQWAVLTMQSVPITTNLVNSNPAQGEVYSIHYVISLSVTCSRSGQWFSPPIK